MTRERSPAVLLVFASSYLLTWAAAGIVAFGISDAAAGARQEGSRHEHCRPSTE
jgi:predicted metal-binding membrane protein